MNTSVSEVLDRIAPETEPTPDWGWVLRQASWADPEPERQGKSERGHRTRRLLDARSLRRPMLLGVCVVVAAALALVVAAP